MFVCVVSLSQPSSRDLLCAKCLCVLSRYVNLASSSDLVYPLWDVHVPEIRNVYKLIVTQTEYIDLTIAVHTCYGAKD